MGYSHKQLFSLALAIKIPSSEVCILLSKKHYIGSQADGKVIIKGMEGKKRDRSPFFNEVFSQLIDDYKNNNKSGLVFNVLNAFKQLESA